MYLFKINSTQHLLQRFLLDHLVPTSLHIQEHKVTKRGSVDPLNRLVSTTESSLLSKTLCTRWNDLSTDAGFDPVNAAQTETQSNQSDCIL